MRTKPIDIINATRTIDSLSLEDAKSYLIEILNSHPAIVTRIVNTAKKFPEPVQEECTDDKLYKVVIRNIGGKINAIKMVRAMTGADLKDSKDFVEGVGQIAHEGDLLPYGVIAQNKTCICASGIMQDALAEANGMVTLQVIPQDAPYKYSF